MKQSYGKINLRDTTKKLIAQINVIINKYLAQGYTLSVRQVFYQLVAADMIKNNLGSYQKVAQAINDGRTYGMIDWDAIEDRNRNIATRSHWNDGRSILQDATSWFHMDMWENQVERVIVIVEKAALEGILGGVCSRYDVPILAARGYPSVSILREMALEHIARNSYQPHTILHFGDHDPSGCDMTRDIDERLNLFCHDQDVELTIKRCALNMDQIKKLNPPPNYAKSADARFAAYKKMHGEMSWELDAIEPAALDALVTSEITSRIDDDAWDERKAEIEKIRDKLKKTAANFKE